MMKKLSLLFLAILLTLSLVSAGSVLISPTSPDADDDLTAYVSGEENTVFDYYWVEDGATYKTQTGKTSTLDAFYTDTGETWTVYAYVPESAWYDSYEYGHYSVVIGEAEDNNNDNNVETNHAPQATDIHFSVTEGDLVDVDTEKVGSYWTYYFHLIATQAVPSDVMYLYDADGDTLKVSYESLLDNNGKWQTSEGDAGVYTIIADVSDSKLVTEATITITVKAAGAETQNTCPVVDANDITVYEGDLAVADYTTYDADGDKLITKFSIPFVNGQWQTEVGDAEVRNVMVIVSDGECNGSDIFTVTVLERPEDGNTCPTVSAEDVVVEEGDLAEAEFTVSGAEGDYTVYFQSPYDDKGQWQTQIGNAGVYYTMIGVIDGDCESMAAFKTTVTCLDANNNGVCDSDEGTQETCPTVSAEDVVVEEGDLAEAEFTVSGAEGDYTVYFQSPYDDKGQWQTEVGDAGEYYTMIGVIDGDCESLATFKTTVTCLDENNNGICDSDEGNDNSAPVLDNIADVEVDEGETVNVCASATDADGDSLTYTYEGTPGGSFDSNGCWIWDTTYHDAGKYDVEVTVSDGQASDSTSFEVKVNDICEDVNLNDICDNEEYVKSNYEGDLLKVLNLKVLNANDLYSAYDVSDLNVNTEGSFYVENGYLYNQALDDSVKVYLEMSNENSFDARDIEVNFVFDGKTYPQKFYDLDRSEKQSRVYEIEIPEDLETGKYPLKVIIENDDVQYEQVLNVDIVSLGDSITTEKDEKPIVESLWDKIKDFFNRIF